MDDALTAIIEKEKERLLSTLFSDKKPSSKPRAYILGGQPAAGKTSLINLLKTQQPDGDNLIVINGVEYRVYHPDYLEICKKYDRDAPSKTQKFANKLVEFVKNKCLDEKYSFIIEGTMRDYQTIKRTIDELMAHSFSAELHVLAVPFEESLIGIFERYEYDKARTGIGRFSPLETHEEAYFNIPVNIHLAAKEFTNLYIKIYERKEGKLISHDFSEGIVLFGSLLDKNSADKLDRWLVINGLAKDRNETDPYYLALIQNQVKKYATP